MYLLRGMLYLIEILHQTTTRTRIAADDCRVVSYRNSTSNHNGAEIKGVTVGLYLIEILHQTTTGSVAIHPAAELYLIEILHQTTTAEHAGPWK